MDSNAPTTSLLERYLAGRVTRARLLAAVGAGMTALAVPSAAGAAGETASFPYFPAVQGTYSPESVRDIMNNIVTPAYFAVAGLAAILSAPAQYGLSGLPLAIIQAIAAEEQYHIDFWTSKGATPVTTSFTVPASAVGNAAAALSVSEVSATIQTAAFMTAVREFAELGQPELAKWAYQTGAQEAGQRVAYRFMEAIAGNADAVPPVNKAFETDLFLYTRDAIAAYRALGLIGGNGVTLAYPGRAAILGPASPVGASVKQTVPNDATSSVTITGLSSLTDQRS